MKYLAIAVLIAIVVGAITYAIQHPDHPPGAPRKPDMKPAKWAKQGALRRGLTISFGLCPDPKGSSSPEITIPVVPGSPWALESDHTACLETAQAT